MSRPGSSRPESVYTTRPTSGKLKHSASEHVLADIDPLIRHIKSGDSKAVRHLLKDMRARDRVSYLNAFDRNGSTAIFHAVWPGHVDVLRMLLEYGANPNIQNNRLNTALHLACERGHEEVIRLLIDFGAEPTSSNWQKKVCWQIPEDTKNQLHLQSFVAACRKVYVDRVRDQIVMSVTPEQRAHYHSLFDAIDADGDGKLQFPEIRPFLMSMPGERVAEADMKEFFDYLDYDNDGCISFSEFLRGVLLDLSVAEKKKKKKKGKGGKGKKKKGKTK